MNHASVRNRARLSSKYKPILQLLYILFQTTTGALGDANGPSLMSINALDQPIVAGRSVTVARQRVTRAAEPASINQNQFSKTMPLLDKAAFALAPVPVVESVKTPVWQIKSTGEIFKDYKYDLCI
jgi:hypothetical protein